MRSAPRTVPTGISVIAFLVLAAVAACGTSATDSSQTGASPGTSSKPTASPKPTSSPPPSAALTAAATATPAADPNAGWATYHSAANHLTLRVPPDMSPLECGWVFIDPSNPTSCPQGDGFCCVFLRSSDNGQTGSFSAISDNRSLYSDIKETSVTVDGVTGTRISGNQTMGQGGGPQVEYDFTTRGRTYKFFAYIGGDPASLAPGAPTAALFDRMISTVTFTS